MSEWVLLDRSGNVLNIIQTRIQNENDRAQLLAKYAQLQGVADVVPIDKVPTSKLKAYQYWEERP